RQLHGGAGDPRGARQRASRGLPLLRRAWPDRRRRQPQRRGPQHRRDRQPGGERRGPDAPPGPLLRRNPGQRGWAPDVRVRGGRSGAALSTTAAGSSPFMITPELIADHNLSEEEYSSIVRILGREPNLVELGIFSAMWSEHCSYKSSRVHLR